MNLGNKIKALRTKAGVTQEKLAEELGVSYQSVSKWENNVCAPDIAMLPRLSVYFGVTIDEIFDLTVEDRLARIENMLLMEQEIPHYAFTEMEQFLKSQLENKCDEGKIYSLLAHLYYHRVASDSEMVTKYAQKSIMAAPDRKECQWLLMKTQGAAVCDWNVKNHNKVIDFYKERIKEHPEIGRNYLYLMDNLLEDNRIGEVREYLEEYKKLEGYTEFMILIYEAQIALAEHKPELAEDKYRELEEQFPESAWVIFELGNYNAEKCEYDKAIAYFERAFALEPKPRYMDALQSIMNIYEIQEKYDKAMECCDRLLEMLKEERNLTEGKMISQVQTEKQRIAEKIRK